MTALSLAASGGAGVGRRCCRGRGRRRACAGRGSPRARLPQQKWRRSAWVERLRRRFLAAGLSTSAAALLPCTSEPGYAN